LRELGIELSAEKELQRIVQAALHGFFHEVYHRVSARLSDAVRLALDQLLVVEARDTQAAFDALKAEPSRLGVKSLREEVTQLQRLRAVGISARG
jgi:hypothetical protein